MKKKLFTMMAFAAALCACTKEQTSYIEQVEGNSIPLVFTATMEGAPGKSVSKATFDNSAKCASWELNDQISINGRIYSAEKAGSSTTFSELQSLKIRPFYVSSESKGFSDDEAPRKLVDSEGTSTKWCAKKPDHSNESGIWDIVVKTEIPAKLQAIELWNANDTKENPGRRWKDVKVSGSTSANGDWCEIKTFENLDLATDNCGIAGTLNVDATQEYEYYKVEILNTVEKSTSSTGIMQMSDMLFSISFNGQDKGPYKACFPANLYGLGSMSLPAHILEAWSDGKFDMPMYAYSTTSDLNFKNLCGVLKITVKSDQIAAVKNIRVSSANKAVSGTFTVNDDNAAVLVEPSAVINTLTVTYTDAIPTTAEGKVFYVAIPAQTYHALKIELDADGNGFTTSMTTKASTNIVVDRNKIYPITFAENIPPKPEPDPDAKNLSADGTANCYIVSEYGPYKFDATKKGHTNESVGAIASAEVLWESFGTDVQPEVGDIVSNVCVKDGVVGFTASGNDGNAVIAVKDAAGDILWSWHIWICKGFDPVATAQVYNNNAGIVMDRNLGAISATKGDVRSLGLLYQWGRKDPFIGCQLIYYYYGMAPNAKSTITWPLCVLSDASTGTIDYAVKHPTTFIKRNISNFDWYYTGNGSTEDARWNSFRGTYDPCPAGWRVPDGGDSGLWAEAFGSASDLGTALNWDPDNYGIDFGTADKTLGTGTIWYPASGKLNSNGWLDYVGQNGAFWSCNRAYGMFFNKESISPSSNFERGFGLSVRCVKETPRPEPDPNAKDLSADGTANCYIVSEYGPCKFDATKKGHTNEPVGAFAYADVLWESFGTDVKPEVGDIVSNVCVKDGVVGFTASGKDGNAVIAVKDVFGEILWSWHIWVCKGFDPLTTAQVYKNNAGTVMDRNLGATSSTKGDVRSLGLLYQWGRKDPFLSGGAINSNTRAESTITWPSAVLSTEYGTINFVVTHPTTYVVGNIQNLDWYYDELNNTTRWNPNKGTYDPCPKGWKVPDGDKTNGLWSKALGSPDEFRHGPWDSTNKGMDFADKFTSTSSRVWYPASGWLHDSDTPSQVGIGGFYWACTPRVNWTCTPPDYYSNFLETWDDSGYVYPCSAIYRSCGLSVRCVKE